MDWSIPPAGLSSNDYNGHIFWDAETWMYPSLLAQHADLAAGMNNYRFDRLAAAQAHARATGYAGARFPWESAHWATAAQVSGKTQGTQDDLTFGPVRARYVRVQITAATYGTPPMLEEITVPGGKHP